MERRAFFNKLGAGVKQEIKLLLPPYSGVSMEGCINCDAPCVSSCETDILFKNSAGHVEVDFKMQGCTYCKQCLETCDKGVLDESFHPFINAVVYIDTATCISHHGVLCMACKEPCMDDAIKFEGLFKPEIISQSCTACGFCTSRCPTGAIKVVA